jgi:hypothetical protein
MAVAGAVALGICGFNVTIPHKETIVPLLDEVAVEASFVGAVNTVRIVDGRTVGYNTDGEGFLQPLRALNLPLTDMPVCVLGAGGAARAITMALLQAGCPILTVTNRTHERSERLVSALRERFPQARLSAVPFRWCTILSTALCIPRYCVWRSVMVPRLFLASICSLVKAQRLSACGQDYPSRFLWYSVSCTRF